MLAVGGGVEPVLLPLLALAEDVECQATSPAAKIRSSLVAPKASAAIPSGPAAEPAAAANSARASTPTPTSTTSAVNPPAVAKFEPPALTALSRGDDGDAGQNLHAPLAMRAARCSARTGEAARVSTRSAPSR